ncbi:MAG: Xaa-Pro peptidase family protein [Anaerolineales bacterium]|nr:Xaa-Pro peptidase family protein [Anaerolineales bacterium]
MKADLDAHMQAAGLDALLILSDGMPHAATTYFCGTTNAGTTLLLKPRGQPPILFHGNMEREQAALTGLPTRNFEQAGWGKTISSQAGEQLAAELEALQVRGNVAVHGKAEAGAVYSFLKALEQAAPQISLALEDTQSAVLMLTRSTKDAAEVERMRTVARATVSVVGNVVDFLMSHPARDGRLVNQQGEPLTVGEVKRRINLWLAMKDLENPEGTILAIGRETAFPHSTGRSDQPIPLGVPIILDIFPREAGGGYFYDFTRTWSLGRAGDQLLAAYQDVADCYHASLDGLRLGRATRELQSQACDLFEAGGHPTLRSRPGTTDGYVHSLGHGVGLDVHEPPSMRHLETERSILQAGMVFTIEPGLYYPDRGFGVRLENTYVLGADGRAEALAEFPEDLVLRAPGW